MVDILRVDESGISALSLPAAQEEVERRLQGIFGADLTLSAQTPQGQLAGLIALLFTEVSEQVVSVGNGASLDSAVGNQLADQGSLLRIEKQPATYSHVTATATGVNGTGLPVGARARTGEGAEFETTEPVTLTSAGVSVEMQATVTGPVAAPAGALTSIVTVIPDGRRSRTRRPPSPDATSRPTRRTARG